MFVTLDGHTICLLPAFFFVGLNGLYFKKESVILIENASNIQWEVLKSVLYYAIKLKNCYKEAFYIILKSLKRSVKTI